MARRYTLYGLSLSCSSCFSLPLRTTQDQPDFRVLVRILSEPQLSHLADRNSENTEARAFEESGGLYFFRYADGCEIVVHPASREIEASRPERFSVEYLATYVVGPVTGLLLHMQGTPALHASVIRIADGAIAILGGSGAGKSTTAAAFALAGYRIVADDILALRPDAGQFLALPGYPRVNLWPESVRLLFGREDALPLVAPDWNKRYLPLEEAQFQEDPLPVRAIYVLERDANSRRHFLALRGNEALHALLANIYGGYMMDREMQARDFPHLVRLANTVPVRRALLSDAVPVRQTIDWIVDDFRSLS